MQPASEAMCTDPRWGNEGRERKAAAIRETLLLAAGPGIDAGTWVDVGCGSGRIAASLADHVARVIGVDPEPWSGWSALQQQKGNLSYHTGSFDADVLPIAEGSADVIVCNQVYEHVADPHMLVHNIARAMKPEGIAYFAGPNLLWPVEPHVSWPFVHWLPRRTAQAAMRLLGSKQHADLDAYSTHLWRLHGWFRSAGLANRNAIRERIATELRLRSMVAFGRLVDSLPRPLYDAWLPLAPGFVFVLRKRK